MRVLYVVPTFYPAVCYGGPIFSVLRLCSSLRELGCQVKVLTTDANGSKRLSEAQKSDKELAGLDIVFSRRYGTGMVAPSIVSRIFEEARKADLVHLTAVYNFPTFPVLAAARFHSKPLVWSPRGTLQRWKKSRRLAAKLVWEQICGVVKPSVAVLHATSEEEARESAHRLGCRRTEVIPNGIDLPPVPPPGDNDGILKLLFIGRLDPKKGIENLIQAVSLLPSGMPVWRLQVVGDGEPAYVARLRSMAAREELSGRIEFRGHLDGELKSSAFAQSDMVIVPSYTENFGGVVAEALAHSRPVIASRNTPWRGLVQNECGLWVENDPASLAAAIQKLGRDDFETVGRRGREWMARDFSWIEQAKRMQSLYKDLVSAN